MISSTYTANVDQNTMIRASGTTMNDDISQAPPSSFLRFTWKDKILINGVGKLDRFLHTGFVLRNRWCVIRFLQNESFAHAYALSNAPFGRSLATNKSSLEAHVFFDEYHGSCAVYSRRLRNRMLQNEDCLESFLYGARHVIVMRIQRKLAEFRLCNTKEEFPILVDQDQCIEKTALRRRHFRGKSSFAGVAGQQWPGTSFYHEPIPVSGGKSALERELENIEKTRLEKKTQKQRAKRQSPRDNWIADKWRSTKEVQGAKKSSTKTIYNSENNACVMCKPT